MFNNTKEVFNWLYNQKKLTKRENLDRIKRCSDLLHLNSNYKIIHIAGTNGKGSTASYIKNILMNDNHKVGFFVSPFVVCFNERIQINDTYIADNEIIEYSNILFNFSQEYFSKYNDVIPFFELTLLMSLMHFKKNNIDVAIIECGMGGLLDSTNFLKTDLAIITNVGFDHMNSLGNTLESIANHKLGIIKENMNCITAVSKDLKEQFDNHAINNNSTIYYVNDYIDNIVLDKYTIFNYKNYRYEAGLIGTYQAYNASLAIEAINQLYPDITYENICIGLKQTKWPGRMEIIKHNPLIILDGAHNIDGIYGLKESLFEMKKNRKIKVIFSALQDKAYEKMLNILDEIVDYYYFTSIVDVRGTNPLIFAEIINHEYEIIDDMNECIDEAMNNLSNDEILVVTGSLHFISLVRNYIFSK